MSRQISDYPFYFVGVDPAGLAFKSPRHGREELRFLVFHRDPIGIRRDGLWVIADYCESADLADESGKDCVRRYGGAYQVVEAEVVYH